MWTVVLLSVGITGLWIAAKHWWGWWINAASEILWASYAIHIKSQPLFLMALVWLAVNIRNAIVSRKAAA